MPLDDLRAAVEEVARHVPQRELIAAFDRITVSYDRRGRRTSTETPTDAVAYAVGRAPGTYTAVARILLDVGAQRPRWEPVSLLDLGAGTGAASWAAADVFPSLRAITLVEHASQMATTGERIIASAPASLSAAIWLTGDASQPPAGPFDLVIASYVLGELPDAERTAAVRRWFDATDGEIVIVEPGSRDGFEIVRRAREHLIAAGATVTAPCPHEAPCPMPADDWCHFGVRVQRSRLQRRVKSGERGFEDEKYSYVVASKQGSVARSSRILRRPERHGGHVRLRVCATDGIDDIVVAKRDGDRYRRARKADWGDAFDVSG